EQLNGAFWIVVGASTLLTGIVLVASDLIGVIFAEPRLAAVLRVMSVLFLLNSFGMVPYALLTKAIHLHRRSLADVCGVMASIPVALGLAYLGHGVWALVFAHLARAVVLNALLAILAAWKPGFNAAFHDMGHIMSFGLRVVGAQVVNTLSNSANTMIVGRMLGGLEVGLYSMARGLADGPHRISSSIVNQISFPIFARVQTDRQALTRYFLRISKYLAIISLPIQVGIALVAADLVPLVLSPSWNDMVGSLQIFALGGLAVGLSLPSGPLLQARGRPEVVLRFVLISSAAIVVPLATGALFALLGVALASLYVLVPARFRLVLAGLREIGLSLPAYCRHLSSPLLATGAMALVVVLVQRFTGGETSPVFHTSLAVCAGALTYPGILLALDRGLGADLRSIARDLTAPAKA